MCFMFFIVAFFVGVKTPTYKYHYDVFSSKKLRLALYFDL